MRDGQFFYPLVLVVRFWVIVLCFALSGCTQPSYAPICPTLVQYSQQDQQELKRELLTPPEKPMIVRWTGDYIGLRDQVRACEGKK